jgi:tetratricopeptide (TPR) repeat protein
VTGTQHGECLTDETLTEYLEGALDPAIKAASEVHLLACDDCRGRLSFFMRLLDQEVKPEEVAQVQVFTAKWGGGRGTRKVARRSALSRWLVGLAGVAAILVLGVVSFRFIIHRQEPQTADEVVQLLLAQQRPFESRISGQTYLPIEQTRGVSKPDFSFGLLDDEMNRFKASAHEMGRFYLLQKDFGHAIPYLEMAAAEAGAAAAVHNDLGVAYFESGSTDERSEREFRRALDLDAAFAPAVFNLALFYERANAVERAVAEWKRYLELDPKSEWGTEARRKIQELSR